MCLQSDRTYLASKLIVYSDGRDITLWQAFRSQDLFPAGGRIANCFTGGSNYQCTFNDEKDEYNMNGPGIFGLLGLGLTMEQPRNHERKTFSVCVRKAFLN